MKLCPLPPLDLFIVSAPSISIEVYHDAPLLLVHIQQTFPSVWEQDELLTSRPLSLLEGKVVHEGRDSKRERKKYKLTKREKSLENLLHCNSIEWSLICVWHKNYQPNPESLIPK